VSSDNLSPRLTQSLPFWWRHL